MGAEKRVGAGDRAAGRRRARLRRRAVWPVAAIAALLAGPSLGAQEAPKAPAAVADEYLRSIEAAAWRAAAQRVHPDALARLRSTVRMRTRPESGRRLLDALSGGQTAEEYFSLDDRSIFVSVLRALERESPGIVNALTDRDTEVLGTVAEGDTLRHVVYRLQWRLSGAEDEMKVMTLAPEEAGRWRILRAPELESLGPALLGLVLPVPGGPGGSSGVRDAEGPPATP